MADTQMPEVKRLFLSDTDKKLAGVCGGIAEYAGIDSTAIRLLWVVITIITGIIPGIVAYIIAAAIMPHAPANRANSGA